jgi:hypothetical protein
MGLSVDSAFSALASAFFGHESSPLDTGTEDPARATARCRAVCSNRAVLQVHPDFIIYATPWRAD